MEHIVSFSGGKDSTAMLLMMLEKNMPIDEIILVMALILYSATQVIRQRRQMKEWSRNHTNVGGKGGWI